MADEPRDLTPTELLLMRAVWDGKRTTREIYDSLDTSKKQLAFTTVATYLQRLEQKGVLRREPSDAREYRYIPLVAKVTIRDHLSEKAHSLFDKTSDLLQTIAERTGLPEDERKRLRRIVSDMRKKGQ